MVEFIKRSRVLILSVYYTDQIIASRYHTDTFPDV
jgi:hypothetical protein